MTKSITFGIVHVTIAFAIGYMLTGDIALAGAITLIEPAANTVVHYLFDRWWGDARIKAAWARWRAPAPQSATP